MVNCTTERIMVWARDTDPMYYERHLIDYNNKRALCEFAETRVITG
jgi:hypothetical protein